jgi:catechol 2,3-dioxygenase-like lactoylglutathione lyase family enzyme
MLRGIDHLVIAVRDPDAAAAELTERLGLAFGAGGRHPGSGTFNRIAFLGEAYLELFGIDDERLAAERPIGAAALHAMDAGGGLATYALVDDDLEVTVRELHANGSHIGPVQHGTRQRPDGELVEWWTATFEHLGPDAPPFLIRHSYVGAEWGAAALAERRAFVHPIGSQVTLVRLDLAAPDPPSLAATYQQELGLELWSVADLAVASVGPHAVRLRPVGEMPLPAIVVLGADIATPHSVTALGLRFDVEPVRVAAVS